MKKLNSILFLAVAAIMAICVGASCSSDSDEELNPFYDVDTAGFHKEILFLKNSGAKYVIVDGRGTDLYNLGHISGAQVYPDSVNAKNTETNSSAFPQWLQNNYPSNEKYYILVYGCPYLYGPGRISKCGYGKSHTFYLNGGYEAWKKAYPNEIEK